MCNIGTVVEESTPNLVRTANTVGTAQRIWSSIKLGNSSSSMSTITVNLSTKTT